jgi:hypothetical protein
MAMAKPAWSAPPLGWVKLNSNAAFQAESAIAAAGIIIGDHEGKVILVARSGIQGCRDAEEGLELMEDRRHEKIILEVDCASVANTIQSSMLNRPRLCFTVEEARRMLENHPNFRIEKIRRESNKATDALAWKPENA